MSNLLVVVDWTLKSGATQFRGDVGSLYGETFQGKVVGISDGDTITVRDSSKTQHKMRLAGIDAPEKTQAFGKLSEQHLSDLVFGKTVTVDWNKTDKYGRTVGKVIVNGQDANLRQVPTTQQGQVLQSSTRSGRRGKRNGVNSFFIDFSSRP